MTFFDYPTTDRQPAPARLAEIFLPDASDDDWATLLRYCSRRRFAKGDVVLDPGGSDCSLYLIVDGSLDVLAPQPGRLGGRLRWVSTVGSGSVLGEVSFFDGAGRSARVQAITPVEVVELSRSGFAALAAAHPLLSNQILLDLGRILASRLRTGQHSTGQHSTQGTY
jgi:CRP/FNR family transcriptional regulator, cyclic AMP receptor protein